MENELQSLVGKEVMLFRFLPPYSTKGELKHIMGDRYAVNDEDFLVDDVKEVCVPKFIEPQILLKRK